MNTALLVALVVSLLTGMLWMRIAHAIHKATEWEENVPFALALGCSSPAGGLLAYLIALVSFIVLVVRFN